MLVKEIKIPLIIGLVLYGAALIISLLCVLFQNDIYKFWGGFDLGAELKNPVIPLATIYQSFEMLMYAVYTLVMFKYKGSSRKLIGIVLTVVYCVINIAYPFIIVAEKFYTSRIQGETELAALSTLDSAVSFCTVPFITISTVLLFIAIGRFGITKRENTEILNKEVQTND